MDQYYKVVLDTINLITSCTQPGALWEENTLTAADVCAVSTES